MKVPCPNFSKTNLKTRHFPPGFDYLSLLLFDYNVTTFSQSFQIIFLCFTLNYYHSDNSCKLELSSLRLKQFMLTKRTSLPGLDRSRRSGESPSRPPSRDCIDGLSSLSRSLTESRSRTKPESRSRTGPEFRGSNLSRLKAEAPRGSLSPSEQK
jgi:hypothetical protein